MSFVSKTEVWSAGLSAPSPNSNFGNFGTGHPESRSPAAIGCSHVSLGRRAACDAQQKACDASWIWRCLHDNGMEIVCWSTVATSEVNSKIVVLRLHDDAGKLVGAPSTIFIMISNLKNSPEAAAVVLYISLALWKCRPRLRPSNQQPTAALVLAQQL
jgi:hypothetical protein